MMVKHVVVNPSVQRMVIYPVRPEHRKTLVQTHPRSRVVARMASDDNFPFSKVEPNLIQRLAIEIDRCGTRVEIDVLGTHNRRKITVVSNYLSLKTIVPSILKWKAIAIEDQKLVIMRGATVINHGVQNASMMAAAVHLRLVRNHQIIGLWQVFLFAITENDIAVEPSSLFQELRLQLCPYRVPLRLRETR